MQYAHIVFIHDYNDSTVEDFLNGEISENEIIEYLSQWDYGDYHDLSDTPKHGTDDDVFIDDLYIFSYNRKLGYVGLEIMLDV